MAYGHGRTVIAISVGRRVVHDFNPSQGQALLSYFDPSMLGFQLSLEARKISGKPNPLSSVLGHAAATQHHAGRFSNGLPSAALRDRDESGITERTIGDRSHVERSAGKEKDAMCSGEMAVASPPSG